MGIQLEHAQWLWGLCLLPLLWLLTLRSRALLTLRARMICASIRALVLILVILALTRPTRTVWTQQQQPTAVIRLLDRSLSVQEAAGAIDARCRDYDGLAHQVDRCIDISFARSTAAGASLPAQEQAETDIEGALQRARAEIGAGCQAAVLVFTDGRATRGDTLQAAAQLRGEDVPVYAVAAGRYKQAGPRIVGVEPPPRVHVGEPAPIRVRVKSDYPANVEVRLLDPKGMQVDRRILDCSGECTVILRHIPSEPGLQKCSVALIGSADVPGEQTMALAPYLVEGPPRVLLVDTLPEETSYLCDALTVLGVMVDRRPCAGLSMPPEELNGYEAVILCDCAGPDFDATLRDELVKYVEERGGGLLFLAGRNVSVKRWKDSPLQAILPVELLPEPMKVVEEQRPVHVCYVLDKSGSMAAPLGLSVGGVVSKMDRVKDAVHASVKELPATAVVSVVAFDAATTVVAERIPVGQWASASGPVDQLAADGGTVMDTAVETAISLLQADKMPGYIVLLTDGQTQQASPEDPGVRWGNLVRQMVAMDISLCTVAVGQDADANLLKQLADAAGGTSYFCSTADEIPKVFIKQAKTIRQVSRQELVPCRVQAGPASDLLRNIPIDQCPMLAAALSAQPRPLSRVALVTDKGKPLLATWQYGLGRVVAFTSDAKPIWARRWVAWDQFGRFWSQVASWVLRPPVTLQAKVEPVVRGDLARILVRATDTDGHPATGLKASGAVSPASGPDQTQTALVWQETRPGIYEGYCRLAAQGNYLCRISLASSNRSSLEHVMVLRRTDQAELLETGPDMAALQSLAEAGGGQVDPPVQQVAETLQRSSQQAMPVTRQYWVWLALAAILLWPVDVAVRRFLG